MQDVSFHFDLCVPTRASHGSMYVSNGHYREPGRVLDEYELVYVKQGRLRVTEEDREYTVEPGQTLLYAPGVRHSASELPGQPLHAYWVRFSTVESSVGCSIGLQIPKVATIACPFRMQDLWRMYFAERAETPPNQGILALIVAQMICEVGRAGSALVERMTSTDALAAQARVYIQEHYAEPISTSTIAAALDCNPNYLARAFSKAYGKTVTEFIYDVRLFYAHEYLVGSRVSITEVAKICGFRDRCYFRHVFSNRRGMSPLAYRKLYGRIATNL